MSLPIPFSCLNPPIIISEKYLFISECNIRYMMKGNFSLLFIILSLLPIGTGVWFSSVQFSSVQFSRSVVSDSLRPHEPQHARPPCPSPTAGVHSNPCPLTRWCHPAISSSLVSSPPTFNLSEHHGLFNWVSSLHQVAKVSEFQLQHQSSNEHPGLISFRIDWLDLLAVQGTLKSLLQ